MSAVSDPSDVELADEELSLVEISRLLLHGSYLHEAEIRKKIHWLLFCRKEKKNKLVEYQITLRLAIWALLSGLRFSTKEK